MIMTQLVDKFNLSFYIYFFPDNYEVDRYNQREPIRNCPCHMSLGSCVSRNFSIKDNTWFGKCETKEIYIYILDNRLDF